MWIADNWSDYEILDTSKGEKLERWAPTSWCVPTRRSSGTRPGRPGWKHPNGHYHRSKKGGGEWEFFSLPEQWSICYPLCGGKQLTFNLKALQLQAHRPFPGAGRQLGLVRPPHPEREHAI